MQKNIVNLNKKIGYRPEYWLLQDSRITTVILYRYAIVTYENYRHIASTIILQICYRYVTAIYGIYRPTASYSFCGKIPEFADGWGTSEPMHECEILEISLSPMSHRGSLLKCFICPRPYAVLFFSRSESLIRVGMVVFAQVYKNIELNTESI